MVRMRHTTVRGRVSGPGVSDFSGCLVYLYDTATGKTRVPGRQPPVRPDGRYSVSSVRPGTWRVFCLPDSATPLAAMTYHQKQGYRDADGTPIEVRRFETITANFSLRAAGQLRVVVTDQAGQPIAGAHVMSYIVTRTVAATPPTTTDASGVAVLANVPLASKLLVIGPSGFGGAWWDNHQSWSSAKVLELPKQDRGRTINVTLPPA